MTTWVKQGWRDALHSPFALFVVALFCFAIWPAIFLGIVSDRNAVIARQKAVIAQAQVNAIQKQLLAMKDPPFHNPKLELIGVSGQPLQPPTKGALYIEVCKFADFVRSVDVARPATAFVGRSVTSPTFSMPLLPGIENWPAGHRHMYPHIQVASNWPRYQFLDYNTFLQDAAGGSSAVQMQDVHLFIYDAGQTWKPGDPRPKPPANPGPQPSCPAATNTAPASPP